MRMIPTFNQKVLPCLLSALLIAATTPQADAAMMFQAQPTAPPASPSYLGQGAPETADELQALVAPIALYPDALVAQVLSASTFPDQVGAASYWLDQNKSLTGSALMTAVDKQTWDPSVKALTQFPSV